MISAFQKPTSAALQCRIAARRCHREQLAELDVIKGRTDSVPVFRRDHQHRRSRSTPMDHKADGSTLSPRCGREIRCGSASATNTHLPRSLMTALPKVPTVISSMPRCGPHVVIDRHASCQPCQTHPQTANIRLQEGQRSSSCRNSCFIQRQLNNSSSLLRQPVPIWPTPAP
jgi:hypothetical protein